MQQRGFLGSRVGLSLVGVWLAVAACSATPARHTGQGQGNSQNGGDGAANGGSGGVGGSPSFGNSDAAVTQVTGGSLAPDPAQDAGATMIRDQNCGQITAIVRDFTPDTNSDFEMDNTIDFTNLASLIGGQGQKGIVKPMLENGYPAYAPAGATAMTHSALQFYQWYVDTPGVNQRFEVPLPLTEDTPGHFVYDSTAFFPIDGKGFGDYMASGHNFHFTTEIRTKFTYHGGEVLTFRGDDDVWIFVNGVLAVDLGGMHSPLAGTVTMDQFAQQNQLVKGMTYSMDIFQAERHTTGSNFRIETTIDCFTIVKPPPPPPPPPPPQ